jgi:hypothetical protein
MTALVNFKELVNDKSLQLRLEQFNYGFDIIENNFILGKYGYYFNLGSGNYMHNIFSVWADFGLISFVILLFTISIEIKNSLFVIDYEKKENVIVLWLFLHYLISFFLFRSYILIPFWFILGSMGSFFCKKYNFKIGV